MDFFNNQQYEQALKQFIIELENAKNDITLFNTYRPCIEVCLYPKYYCTFSNEFKKWLTSEVNIGNSYAQVCLGITCVDDVYLESNHKVGMQLIDMSADKGNLLAIYTSAARGSYLTIETLDRWKMLADKGVSGVFCRLGVCYKWQLAYDNAMKYFLKAVDAGEYEAFAQIGLMYEKGYGVTKDLVQAASWFRKGVAANAKGFPILLLLSNFHLNTSFEYVNKEDIEYLLMTFNNTRMTSEHLINILKNKLTMTNEEIIERVGRFKFTNVRDATQEIVLALMKTDGDFFDEVVQKFKEHGVFKERIKILEEEVDTLKTHITYMPDGAGYVEAKEHAEQIFGSLSKPNTAQKN